MDTILAGQLIYTNVEAAQSPRGRAGFQALFATEGRVREEDKVEAAHRFFYRPRPGDEEPPKRLFYQAADGRLVIAQIVPLPEPDAANRTGRLFAHALVLAPQDFARLNNDPLRVLRSFPFMTTVEEAFSAGDAAGGIAPAALAAPETVEMPPQVLARWDSIEPKQRRDLLLLAHQRATGALEENGLGLCGSAEATLELIEGLLLQMPALLRARCGFDTVFTGGDLHRTPYWAVGLPDASGRNSRLWMFDLERGEFVRSVDASPRTTHEHWLESRASEPLASLAQRAAQVYGMARRFDGEAPTEPPRQGAPGTDPFQPEDEAAFHELRGYGGVSLDRALRSRLAAQVGPLANALAPQALEWAHSKGSEALLISERGFPEPQLAAWVREMCDHRQSGWSREEAAEVARFARNVGDRALLLKGLCFAQDWERLEAELGESRESDFQEFARWALGGLSFEVEWTAHAEGREFEFGPRLRLHPAMQGATPLLASLLGMTAAMGGQRPPASSGNAWAARIPLLKRSEAPAEAPSQAPPRIRPARWLWLMDEMWRRTSSPRSSPPDSAAPPAGEDRPPKHY